jgi:uncharacterized surface protein with fasciclin (FAS1) repeats
MKKLALVLTLVAILAFTISPSMAQDQTIADIVVASATGETPEFTVLLTAVQAADPAVLEALSDPEASLTVFAPTDAAFAALIEALGEEAFGEIVADPEMLTAILLYHVLDGAVMSSDVVAALEAGEGAFTVPTLLGQYLNVAATEEGGVTVDSANVVLEMVDIEASNGVIHVIDAVLVPEARTIAEIVVESAGAEEPQFTTLLAAVGAADPAVLEALSDPEAELTVFAPTDEAFAAVPADLLAAVLADPAMLTDILLYHVVEGTVGSVAVVELLGEMMEAEVTMLNGDVATITVDEEGGVFINDAEIVITDIDAVNGIIHVISAVILPPAE